MEDKLHVQFLLGFSSTHFAFGPYFCSLARDAVLDSILLYRSDPIISHPFFPCPGEPPARSVFHRPAAITEALCLFLHLPGSYFFAAVWVVLYLKNFSPFPGLL